MQQTWNFPRKRLHSALEPPASDASPSSVTRGTTGRAGDRQHRAASILSGGQKSRQHLFHSFTETLDGNMSLEWRCFLGRCRRRVGSLFKTDYAAPAPLCPRCLRMGTPRALGECHYGEDGGTAGRCASALVSALISFSRLSR